MLKDCNECIHKDVCLVFWNSDVASCEEERTIDSMNESWSIGCQFFNNKWREEN